MTNNLPTLTQSEPFPPSVIPTEVAMSDLQQDIAHGDRAEGPLLFDELLRERSAREYLQGLLDQMAQTDDLMYVYILSSPSGTLYVGVTNNIRRRIQEHKDKVLKGFSKDYGCTNLVYFEIHYSAGEAIDREKQIKKWRRYKKERLIRTLNPPWADLSLCFALIEQPLAGQEGSLGSASLRSG